MNLKLLKNCAGFIKKSALFFFSLFLFNNGYLYSQNCNYSLSLEVVDLHDGSPLKDARIEIKNIDAIGISDEFGKYKFENLCNDIYTLEISHDECKIVKVDVDLKKNVNRKVRLEHHFNELEQVMLTSDSKNISQSLFENKVSKEILDDYNSKTLADVLTTISGVSSLNSGSYLSKPVVNGLHSSRVILINNDSRIEDQNWGVEHAPSIDINSIDNISVIKGASSLKYAGDAIAGVIIAESSKPTLSDTIFGNIFSNLQSNGRGGSVSTSITKSRTNGWYSKYQTTIKRIGDLHSPIYSMTNTSFSERNFSVKTGLNRIDRGFDIYYSFFSNNVGILRSAHATTAGDLVDAINNQIPNVIENFSYKINAPKQRTKHNLIKLKAFKNFDFGKITMGYDFQVNDRKEYDIRRGDDQGKPSTDLNLQTHAITIDMHSKLNNTSNFKTGISARYQKNFPDPQTGIRRIIPDYKKYDLSFYSIYDIIIDQNWQFESGIRYDYSHMNAYKYYRTSFWESRNYDELFPDIVVEDLGTQILTNPIFNFYSFSANLGTSYSIENKKIYFNYSLSSRNPNPAELFSEGLHHSAARIEIGDLRFNSEVGHNLALTFDVKNSNSYFNLSAFVNYINDFIHIIPTEIMPTIRGFFPVWEYRQENAKLYGFDAKYERKYSKKFKSSHQFSLIKGTTRGNNEPIINLPPSNLKNHLSYKFSEINNFKISVDSEYVFRQNEYPNYNFEVYIPTQETYEILDTSTPPEAYHLINFNSSIDFKINPKNSLRLIFKIHNLFNKSYKNYLNRLRYFSDEVGRNFIFSLKYSF